MSVKALLGALALVLVFGCAGWHHGTSLDEYQGQVLRIRDGGSGAERLKTEAAYDPSIKHYVEQTGQPDYLLVVDRYQLQLMYIEDDQIVVFQRTTWNPKSQATVTDGIPDPLASLFTRLDQDRLKEARSRRHGTLGSVPSRP